MKRAELLTILAVKLAFVALATAARAPAPADPNGLRPFGTIGKAEVVLKAGKEAVLFEHERRVCLPHFWFGGNFDGVAAEAEG